ncbi:TetR/AcrR family transcriptional regulator [Phenylobacterium conjunctum]|uniref:TetR/AcrR family transcriptional regulator n=2 Tax=Phenylobacterium TaxID=20 RepID=UPI0036718DC3
MRWGMTMPPDQERPLRRPVGRPRGDGRPHLTRTVVFLAAARLIAEHGYAGTSIRMIAREAEASPASLFNLFAGKDELLNELILYLAQPSLAFYGDLEAEVGAGAAPSAALYRMVFEEARLVASVDRAYVAVFLLPELRQSQFGPARAARRALVAHYQRLILGGLGDGTLVCDQPHLAAEQLFQLTETSLIMDETQPPLSPDDLARATARFCLRGLLADPARLADLEAEAAQLRSSLILPQV